MWVNCSDTGQPRPCQPLFAPQHLPAQLTQGPVGAQSKPQGICPTLRDPVREVLFLKPEGGQVPDFCEATGPEAGVTEETGYSALKGQMGQTPGHTCAAVAIASSAGSKFPSLSFSCST